VDRGQLKDEYNHIYHVDMLRYSPTKPYRTFVSRVSLVEGLWQPIYPGNYRRYEFNDVYSRQGTAH